jgi:hypothetical protein
MNNFERHDVLTGLAAVFGSMLFDAQESVATNSESGAQTTGRWNDLTNLDEVNEIVRLTNAPDPQPTPPQMLSLAEMLGMVHREGDPMNAEAEQMAEEAGAAFSEEGRA